MSTPAHFDSEIFSLTDGAQSSRVPIPLSDDPIREVRQSHLVNTNIESGPLEDLRVIEVPQPLLVVTSPVPSLDDLRLTFGQAHTPVIVDTESELEEAPSETEEFEASEPSDTRITSSHSSASSDSTAPLSPDHLLTQTSPTLTPTRVLFHHRTARMAVRTQSTLSPGMLAQITEASALSPSSFCKRYRSSYETPSPSLSLILPIRKRYRGTSQLVKDTEDESSDSDTEKEGSEDEGPSSDEEEAAPEVVEEGEMPSTFEVGQSSRSVPEHEGAERISAFRQPTLTPPSPEWSFGSLSVSPSSLVVPTPEALPVTTPVATIAVDVDEFLEVGAT
ncbi:hypothetical protein Tco_1140260 [Tanacetum coccineum]